MERRTINAPNAPAPAGGYAQAIEITGAKRLLFISGQIPVDASGAVPTTFRAQCRQAWANVEAQLRAAGLDLSHLVKVTTFLADRAHAMENREVRAEMLGDLKPALTVIIARIFDSEWLVEIEAVAAAGEA